MLSLNNYYELGGTIRSESPTTTKEKLKLLMPLIGITRVADITDLDYIGIPVVTCIRPNAKHLSVSQGKGLTLELAEISGIMESFEGFHIENPREPAFNGSYQELKNHHSLINPGVFNPGFFLKQDIEEYPFDWALAYDLITEKTLYIPHILSCLDSTKLHPEFGFLSVSTNGLAAGNSFDEAICHSLYEIIERDSLCQWRIQSKEVIKKTQIDSTTITDDINKKLIEKIHDAGLQIKVWEITSPLQIPAYHCVLNDPNLLRSLRKFTGTGAHLSKEIALSRALVEAAQARLTLISGNRDDVFPDYYQQTGTKHSLFLEDNLTNGRKDFATCCTPTYEKSFFNNIQFITDTLLKEGYNNIYVIDHTKPNLNLPVAHIFIPGMQFDGSRM